MIPNAINEPRDPERNIPRGIFLSILIAIAIYVAVSLVAVGNLLPEEIDRYKEYALAVAAKPLFGHAGFLLISLGALFSTASAINATLFGTSHLGKVMAEEQALPAVFSMRERTRDIPWGSLVIITFITLVFVNLANLTVISAFASSTFLLIFAAINLAALRLRKTIGIGLAPPLIGVLASLAACAVLFGYLWLHGRESLYWIGISYMAIVVMEFLYCGRRLFPRHLDPKV